MKKLITAAYFLLISAYAVFSYSFTDPNLVLTSWSPYWQFQQFMWHTFFQNAQLLSNVFVVLIALLFGCYFYLFVQTPTRGENQKKNWLTLALLTVPLLLSYNALSHDVFNYIFNSKMILVYHANPLQQVALDFPKDDWIRFMHNTNTPAPYGYGWMIISLVPFLIGFGKFTLTWLMFRLFSLLSIGALIGSLFALLKSDQRKLDFDLSHFFIVLLNPLFLIEIVSNSHNDMWMMAPAILSIAILHRARGLHLKTVLISLAFLAFSISVKLSTLVLIPVWLAILCEQVFAEYQLPAIVRRLTTYVHLYYADFAAILLFLPLLTPRSQQFNPWYLTWLLVWLPFMRWKWLKGAILVLSVSSLFRYLPWLIAGGFSDQIVFEQKLITFIPLILYFLFILVYPQLIPKKKLS